MSIKHLLPPLSTCYTTLFEAEKNILKMPFQSMTNYEEIVLPKLTRSNLSERDCYICLTGRQKSHVKIIKGKGKKRNMHNKIAKLKSHCQLSKITEVFNKNIDSKL